MRITSLNVNNFGGTESKPRYDEYKDNLALLNVFRSNPIRKTLALKIFDKIMRYQSDVIFMHEFDVNSPAGDLFINEMDNVGFVPIYPDGESQKSFLEKSSSITLGFMRKNNLLSTKSCVEFPHRWNQLVFDDTIVVGVHMKYNLKFWDDLIDFCNKDKEGGLIIIGDLNVTDNPTSDLGKEYKEKMNELLRCGMKDVWVELNHSINSPTFHKTRIDYCLVSENVLADVDSIKNDGEFAKSKLTDHSAIIVDLKPDNYL